MKTIYVICLVEISFSFRVIFVIWHTVRGIHYGASGVDLFCGVDAGE